jgi:hypothetical protein
MSKKKKSLIIITAGIVAVMIGLVFLWNHKEVYFQSPIVFLPESQHVIINDKATPVPDEVISLAVPQRYSDKVMQFDENCRAAPVTMVAKVGNTIMFDNRSGYQRAITVGQQSYTVEPFGHIILSFGTIDTYPVSCDSFKRVGIVGIQ